MTAATPTRAPPLDPGAWGVAFMLATLLAKVVLLLLYLWDGAAGSWTSRWLPVALVHEDLRLVGLFGIFVALVTFVRDRRPAAARTLQMIVMLVYAVLTFWVAVNVPVARHLSSPLTYSFLHATGGAIHDSIASYVTIGNIGVPIGLWTAALLLPRALKDRVSLSTPVLVAATGSALAIMLLGPAAVARTDTLGAHRNAVLALLQTTLARRVSAGRAGAIPALPRLSSSACLPKAVPRLGSLPLPDLAGLAQERNIVWVILESTGARALTAYGATRQVMPHLAALAAHAVVFENAYAAYPESIKGLFSFLCSRTPPPHAEASELDAVRAPCPAIAQELGRAGYRTGLFHAGWFAYLGMQGVVDGRGFGQLVDAGGIDSRYRSSFGVDDRAVAQRLLTFVDGQPHDPQPDKGRFFAVFMPIAGHHPYHAPGPASRPFPEANDRDAYYNDLYVADDAFGLLRQGLKARGLDQNTVYVVFGDHGEAFREHPGNVAHALYIYEENVRVPLFIAAPGLIHHQRRAPQLASLIDVAPTTLALAGMNIPASYEGRSLLDGPERVARFFTEQGERRLGLRDGWWKFILNTEGDRAQLFDLRADPGEHQNVAAGRPDLTEQYRRCLNDGR